MNPLEKYLSDHSVNLPSAPIDFSLEYQNDVVSRGYVIVMTGRSGSTWLASALEQIRGFANPEEYFSEPIIHYYWPCEQAQDFPDVFKGILNKYAEDGCFGFKINPQRLFWLGKLVDLEKTFARDYFSWIDMRRWNLVKQGLSYAVAKKSGIWHDFTKTSNETDSHEQITEFTDWDVWREILVVLQQEQAMDQFYSSRGLVPLRIFYEELSDSKSALLTRVCKFIRPEVSLDISKVVDGTAKLDKRKYAEQEQKFTEVYAEILNEIYSNRATISIERIKSLVSPK